MIQHLRNTLFILAGIFLLLTLFAFQGYAFPTSTPGGLLYYTDQTEFEADFPGLPKEDFEESPIAAGTFDFCTGPIDSTTNQPPNCFVPGDILPGLSLDSDPGHQMPIHGIGYGTLTTSSVTLASNPGSDILSISFSGSDVYAVGMDLVAFLSGVGTYTIKVYGTGNTLLDTITSPTVSTSETFFGFFSPRPITQFTLDNGANEIVDNIQFGTIMTSGLTFYTDQNVFETAHPGLPVEDFEESPVASGAFVIFPEPLDSTTNAPGAFSPGDILEGLQIKTISTSTPATSLVIIGDHYSGILNLNNASKMVCSNLPDDDLRILFPGYNAYAIAMDLLPANLPASPPSTAHITAYSLTGNPLGTTTISLPRTQETFFGVHSNRLIGWITVNITNATESECIDNIQFGSFPTGLTFYSTEADFKKARANLPREDFSESPVPDATPQICNEPIDSTTNEAGCFTPGDILPNITFQTENSLNQTCPACMVLYGPNTGPLANTTPLLNVNPPDHLEIGFPGKNVHFTGMILYMGLMSIYGPNDTLLGTAVHFPSGSTLDFWGVESTEPISRITIYGSPFLSDVIFGGKFPWPMYLPALGSGGGSTP